MAVDGMSELVRIEDLASGDIIAWSNETCSIVMAIVSINERWNTRRIILLCPDGSFARYYYGDLETVRRFRG